jgi:hypothetical protein
LRGGLYENFVILEILKSFYNFGKIPRLYFYRDTHGNEIDFVIEKQRKLIPIEIKSAATFSPHFIQGIQKFKAITENRCQDGYVLYNGTEQFTLHQISIQNILRHHLPFL